ncbi:MAG: hypothetical protein RSC93_14170 [Erysipelotrichaceae bacterium]
MNLLKHRDNYNPYGLTMAYGTPYTLEETKTYFRAINITSEELADLNEWIKDGNKYYNNPWCVYNELGYLANFIDGSRLIKDMYEDYSRHLLIPSSSITDSAFIFDDLTF